MEIWPGLFVLCSTPVVSRFLGGCTASQNGHARASSPVFTFRRSFSGTLCLGHFSSAILSAYAYRICIRFEGGNIVVLRKFLSAVLRCHVLGFFPHEPWKTASRCSKSAVSSIARPIQRCSPDGSQKAPRTRGVFGGDLDELRKTHGQSRY